MAFEDNWTAFLSIGDSEKKMSDVEFNVSEADALEYLSAVPGAARAATKIGVLFLTVIGLTDGNPMKEGVRLTQNSDVAAFPSKDAGVYNFDKFGVIYQAGFKKYSLSIPSRDMAAVEVDADAVTIDITVDGTAQVSAFVDAMADTALGENGSASTVEKMYVRS